MLSFLFFESNHERACPHRPPAKHVAHRARCGPVRAAAARRVRRARAHHRLIPSAEIGHPDLPRPRERPRVPTRGRFVSAFAEGCACIEPFESFRFALKHPVAVAAEAGALPYRRRCAASRCFGAGGAWGATTKHRGWRGPARMTGWRRPAIRNIDTSLQRRGFPGPAGARGAAVMRMPRAAGRCFTMTSAQGRAAARAASGSMPATSATG